MDFALGVNDRPAVEEEADKGHGAGVGDFVERRRRHDQPLVYVRAPVEEEAGEGPPLRQPALRPLPSLARDAPNDGREPPFLKQKPHFSCCAIGGAERAGSRPR
jgi:hypothetical protein